ncbi:MAG: type II toxin-antitoxin system VapC family toxin [Candidatus Hydrothermarchaeales archaeon]
MRFLDANIFIYAFYRPRVRLDSLQKRMKDSSKKIIEKINGGREEVMTSVVHLSEVSNILKRSLHIEEVSSLILTLYGLDNVVILDVTANDYLVAVEMAEELRLDPNDALAVHLMQEHDISEIYSFDEGFEDLEGIVRVP